MRDEDINELDNNYVSEDVLDTEAIDIMNEESSPQMKMYLEKYNKISDEQAEKLGLGGVKDLINDYNSGAIWEKFIDISDADIVETIKGLENSPKVVDDSLFANALDVPLQVVGGFRATASELINLSEEIGIWAGGKILEATGASSEDVESSVKFAKDVTKKAKKDEPKFGISEPKNIVSGVVKGVSQFLAPYAALNKLGKAAGVIGNATNTAGKFAEASVVGAATDFTFFNEHESRLSDLVESVPALSNPLTNYLKSDINDGVAEGRFKNAVEGLGVGALAEGLFLGIKAIKTAKVAKESLDEMHTKSKERTDKYDRDFDDFVENVKETPIRNKQSKTLEEIGESSKDIDFTREDIISGKALEAAEKKGTQGIVVRATQIQQEAYDTLKSVIPEYRERISFGDTRAIDDYWNEIVSLQKLDFAAKDLSAAHGGAESMVYRRFSSAVEAANNVYKVFAKADTLDKRKLVEAHMNIVESKGDIDGFMFSILSTPEEKIKRVLKSIHMGNILSAVSTQFKNIAATTLNGLVYAPIERVVGSAVGATRKAIGKRKNINEQAVQEKIANGFFSNMEDGVRWKETQILFHSYFSSIVDGLTYLGRAIKGTTEAAKAAKASGKKLSRLKDITDATARSRFDKGITYDNLADSGFNGMILGINKEKVGGTTMYFLADMIGKVSAIPGSIIQTYDNAFKGMFFKAQAEAQAYRFAVKEGLTGDALKKRWQEIYQMAIKDPNPGNPNLSAAEKTRQFKKNKDGELDDVIENIQNDSVKFAEEYTYTGKTGILGQAGTALRKALDSVPYLPAGSILMPFVRTPANLLKFVMVDRSPLALFTKDFRADIAAGGARADMAMARVTLGTSLLSLGYYLKINGYSTGDGPKNPARRAAQRDLGMQERSILIGGKWVDMSWAAPFSYFFQIPANIVEIMDRNDNDVPEDLASQLTEYAMAPLIAMTQTTLSQSFMQGMSEFIEAITDDSPNHRKIERIKNNVVSSFLIPNIVSEFGRNANPIMQDAENTWEAIKIKAGFDVRQRRDLFGRPVFRNEKINNYLVPISYSNWKNDEVVAQMIEANALIQKPKRQVMGVELTFDEYDRLLEIMEEQDVYGYIKDVIRSPMYEGAANTKKDVDEFGDPVNNKAGLIREAYNAHLEAARITLISENVSLQNRIYESELKAYTVEATKPEDKKLLKNFKKNYGGI